MCPSPPALLARQEAKARRRAENAARREAEAEARVEMLRLIDKRIRAQTAAEVAARIAEHKAYLVDQAINAKTAAGRESAFQTLEMFYSDEETAGNGPNRPV